MTAPPWSWGIVCICGSSGPMTPARLQAGWRWVCERNEHRGTQKVGQWAGLECRFPHPLASALFTAPTFLSVHTHLSLPWAPFSILSQSHAFSHYSLPLLGCTWALSSVLCLSLQLDCQRLQDRDWDLFSSVLYTVSDKCAKRGKKPELKKCRKGHISLPPTLFLSLHKSCMVSFFKGWFTQT